MEQTDISRLGDVIYQEMNASVAGFSNIEEFWDKLTTLISVFRTPCRMNDKLTKLFSYALKTDKVLPGDRGVAELLAKGLLNSGSVEEWSAALATKPMNDLDRLCYDLKKVREGYVTSPVKLFDIQRNARVEWYEQLAQNRIYPAAVWRAAGMLGVQTEAAGMIMAKLSRSGRMKVSEVGRPDWVTGIVKMELSAVAEVDGDEIVQTAWHFMPEGLAPTFSGAVERFAHYLFRRFPEGAKEAFGCEESGLSAVEAATLENGVLTEFSWLARHKDSTAADYEEYMTARTQAVFEIGCRECAGSAGVY